MLCMFVCHCILSQYINQYQNICSNTWDDLNLWNLTSHSVPRASTFDPSPANLRLIVGSHALSQRAPREIDSRNIYRKAGFENYQKLLFFEGFYPAFVPLNQSGTENIESHIEIYWDIYVDCGGFLKCGLPRCPKSFKSWMTIVYRCKKNILKRNFRDPPFKKTPICLLVLADIHLSLVLFGTRSCMCRSAPAALIERTGAGSCWLRTSHLVIKRGWLEYPRTSPNYFCREKILNQIVDISLPWLPEGKGV